MATKIERIDREIAKTREKIAEYQEKLKTLEAQKTEAENLEIVQMVRAMRMTPEPLLPRERSSPRQRMPPTMKMWWWRKPRTALP